MNMLNFNKLVKPIKNTIKNISAFGIILIVLIVILFVYKIFRNDGLKIEGFEQQEKFLHLKDQYIYDDFYARIFNSLTNKNIVTNLEIGSILKSTKTTTESIILDIGCQVAGKDFNLGKNLEIIGIHESKHMIKQAMMETPDLKFMVGNVLNSTQFNPNSFTHILALNMIIYGYKDKRLFINNCFDWLMPGGYFCVFLVDTNNYQPIDVTLPINLITGDSSGKSDITYNANYNKNNNETMTINEKFTFSNDSIRKQEQTLFLEDKEVILTIIQQTGFILQSIDDVASLNYGNQFIYTFVKP